MSVALRGTPVSDFGFGTSTTVTKQAGIQVGDWLIWQVLNAPGGGPATVTTPSGWTLVGTDNTQTDVHSHARTMVHACFKRKVDGTEGSTFTATGTSTHPAQMASIMSCYSGCDPTDCIDAFTHNSGDATGLNTIVATGLTAAGSTVLVATRFDWEADNPALHGTPGTMTQVVTSGGNGAILENLAISAGATGNMAGNCSATETWTNFLIALKAASGGATPVNAGVKPAALPSDSALPPGFAAMPNFGAGLRLGAPAIQLFRGRSLSGLPPAPPLLARRFREDFAIDVSRARARPVPLPLQADLAPRLGKRPANDESAQSETVAQRPRLLPTTPLVQFVPIVRRSEEETAPEEDAPRPKPVSLPLQPDRAPLENRHLEEEVIPDEFTQRTRPRVAPSVDFAPLPSRRSGEQIVPDEVAVRFRQQPAPTALDSAPLPSRHAHEETIPDEAASRYRQQPAPTGFDTPALVARRTQQDGDGALERAATRAVPPQQPTAATVPLAQRRPGGSDDSVGERASRARAVPLPLQADTAPLRGRLAAEQVAPEEQLQRRAPVPQGAPIVVTTPSIPRRILEWIGVEEWLRSRRAVPLPLTADVAPLRLRSSAQEEPAANEAVVRAKLPAPSTDNAPLGYRRAAEYAAPDERAARAPILISAPVGAAPAVTRKRAEETPAEEQSARSRSLPAASVDFAPLQPQRARSDEAPIDEAKRQRPLVNAVPPDVAPLTMRHASENLSVDETARRYQRPVGAAPQVDSPPLSARRATEETLFETVWRRVRMILGLPPPPPFVLVGPEDTVYFHPDDDGIKFR